MSNTYNRINKTFIVESGSEYNITGVTFNGNVITIAYSGGNTINTVINNFSGLTVNGDITANTYFGDGSNLSGISTDNFYITSGTVDGTNLILNRNDVLSAVTIDFNELISGVPTLDSVSFGITSSNTLTLTDSKGNTFVTPIDTFSGLTVNGDINMSNNSRFNIVNNGYLQKTGSNHYLQLLTVGDSIITFPVGTKTLPALQNNQTFTGSNIFSDGLIIGNGSKLRDVTVRSGGGSSTGLSLINTATGGKSYSFFSTNNTSGLGGGRFGVYDDTAQALRFSINNDGKGEFTSSVILPSVIFNDNNGSLSKSGNHVLTLTTTGDTNVTLPMSGVLAVIGDLNPLTGVTFTDNILTLNSKFTSSNILIDNLSGLTVNGNITANTYFGDGSNLSGISTDNFYVTGATINSDNILSLDRNDILSAVTVDLQLALDSKNIFAYDDVSASPLTRRTKYRAEEFIEFEDDAINEETIIKIRPSLLAEFTSTEIIDINGQFYLALDEDKLYQGNAQGLAEGKTLSQVLDGATDTLSASRFHLVGGFIEPYLEEGDIYVGNVNGVAIGQPIATALDTLSIETGIRFKIGIDGKVAIDLPEGEIIKGNANNEGVASPIITGNNKVLATDGSGVVHEADTVDFADILTGTATVDGLLSTTDLNTVASGVKGSFKITNIVIENTTANAVTIDIGSDTGLDDVASAVVVGASGFVDVSVLKALFSKTIEQDIYVSSADWNSANLIIKISVQKVF